MAIREQIHLRQLTLSIMESLRFAFLLLMGLALALGASGVAFALNWLARYSPVTGQAGTTVCVGFAIALIIAIRLTRIQLFKKLLIWLPLFLQIFEEPEIEKIHAPVITLSGFIVHDDHRKKVCEIAESLASRRKYASNLDNWQAAEAKLRELDDKELREIEGTLRRMIEHENTLMNNRIQWFLTITGFLITSIFLVSGFIAGGLPIVLLSLLGFIVSLSFWLSLRIGGEAVIRLSRRWSDYKRRASPSFNEIGVLGSNATSQWNRLAPWSLLPPVLAFFWLVMFTASFLSPSSVRQDSINTYIYIEPDKIPGEGVIKAKCKNKVARFHTGRGAFDCIIP